jgi:hypothetical protein
MAKVSCKQCHQEFNTKPAYLKKRVNHFCTKRHYWDWLKGKRPKNTSGLICDGSLLRGKKRTPETIEKMSKSMLGKTPWNKGVQTGKLSYELRLKMSASHKKRLCHFWRGGITGGHEAIRKSVEYKIWRDMVYERDDFTCCICDRRGCVLNAHHIKSFSKYPESRFDVSNGITLCEKCHQQTKGKEAIYEMFFERVKLANWFISEERFNSLIM